MHEFITAARWCAFRKAHQRAAVIKICINTCTQENLNIPLGPVRVAEEWRANARVNISAHCSLLWNSSSKEDLSVVCISEVVEQSSWWAAYLLKKVISVAMERGMLKPGQTFHHWSDELLQACAHENPHCSNVVQSH